MVWSRAAGGPSCAGSVAGPVTSRARRRLGCSVVGPVPRRLSRMRRDGRDVAVGAVAVALLLSSGCTTASHQQPPAPTASSTGSVATGSRTAPVPGGVVSSPARSRVVGCADAIDRSNPPPWFTVVLGVVALPVSPRSPALGTGPSGKSAPTPRLFAKRGLWVQTGARVQLSVPAGAPDGLRIGWGRPSTLNRAVAVDCADPGRPGWVGFPGGYWLDHPGCVSLTVAARGLTRPVRIGSASPAPGRNRHRNQPFPDPPVHGHRGCPPGPARGVVPPGSASGAGAVTGRPAPPDPSCRPIGLHNHPCPPLWGGDFPGRVCRRPLSVTVRCDDAVGLAWPPGIARRVVPCSSRTSVIPTL